MQGAWLLTRERKDQLEQWTQVERLKPGILLAGGVGRNAQGRIQHPHPTTLKVRKVHKHYTPGLVERYGPHKRGTITRREGVVTYTHLIPRDHPHGVEWLEAGQIWITPVEYKEGAGLYHIYVEPSPARETENLQEPRESALVKTGTKEISTGSTTHYAVKRTLIHVYATDEGDQQRHEFDYTIPDEALARIMLHCDLDWYTTANCLSTVNRRYRQVIQHKDEHILATNTREEHAARSGTLNPRSEKSHKQPRNLVVPWKGQREKVRRLASSDPRAHELEDKSDERLYACLMFYRHGRGATPAYAITWAQKAWNHKQIRLIPE